jgi:IclR family transcriptional regulator, pca regulon regulatory protein
MLSLARGLEVLRCFAEHRKPITISHIAQRTEISRASVRRCLHTLIVLGYITREGLVFSLGSKALSLGYAYLSSNAVALASQPILDQLRDHLHESCSVAVVEGDEICYIARSETSRIISVALRVGSRLPLYCTSMGRVLLSQWPIEAQRDYLSRTSLLQRTSRARTDANELLDIFSRARKQGYAIVDQEMELGLRSIAVPVTSADGRIIAALNVGAQSSRVSLQMLQARFLPELRRVAVAIASELA